MSVSQARSKIIDSPESFGWISIGLHWVAAAFIVALWLVGKSIGDLPDELQDDRRELHMTTAISVWLLLFVRVVWRFRSGHPRSEGQSKRTHRVAKLIHYTMLLVLLVMMFSGPVMVWAFAQPVEMFGIVNVPVASTQIEWLSGLAHSVHATSGTLMLILVLLHTAGALKHLMFHDDDTIIRMLWPKSSSNRTER